MISTMHSAGQSQRAALRQSRTAAAAAAAAVHGRRGYRLSRRPAAAAAAAAAQGSQAGTTSHRPAAAAAAAAQGSGSTTTSQQVGSSGDAEDARLRAAAIVLASVCDQTKAEDVSLLDVQAVCSWTSYMLLCTVMSRPQLLAVLARVEEAAASHGLTKANSPIGSSQSVWELVDFGSIVVQVFVGADSRQHYDLDGFWGLAEEVELPFATTTSSSDAASSSEAGALQQQIAAAFDGGAGAWSKTSGL